MAGYTPDLAYIHDAGFGDLAQAAAADVIRRLRARGIEDGLVMDLGCGSGIGAAELVRAGYDVLGVDISPAMIRLARRRAPGARFVTGSMLRVELPRCCAVRAIGEVVNYAFDPANSRAEIARLFRRVWRALEPGGVFVFDFAEPGQRVGARYVAGEGWVVLVDAAETRGLLERRIVSFRRVGRLWRRTEETHVVRLYRASDLAEELRKIGFRVRVFRKYASLRLRKGCAGIVAVKAG